MVTIVHIALAIALFYIVNWIGHHSISLGYTKLSILFQVDEAPAFNFIFRAFAPVVFIVLASSALYYLHQDEYVEQIWMVSVFYFTFRALYNLALDRARLLNWKTQFAVAAVSIGTSFILYREVIEQRQNLLPDADNLANELWIVVLLFLYATLNNIRASPEGNRRRKLDYLRFAYHKYKRRFSHLITTRLRYPELEPFVYAILIYEAFNRPKSARIIEQLLFPWKTKTLGIMQVTTERRISDEESVILGTEKIVRDYQTALREAFEEHRAVQHALEEVEGIEETLTRVGGSQEPWIVRMALRRTAAMYNPDSDYVEEVLEVFDIIEKEFYPNLESEAPEPAATGDRGGDART